jgi:hypothetical protein
MTMTDTLVEMVAEGLTRNEVTFLMRQKQAATMPQKVPMVPSQIGPPIFVIKMLDGTCIVASEDFRPHCSTSEHSRAHMSRSSQAFCHCQLWAASALL